MSSSQHNCSDNSIEQNNKGNTTSRVNEGRRRINVNQIPEEIINNEILNQKIASTLPKNYNFEIHKTIWKLKSINCKRVALQFPEGLFVFAIAISELLEEFAQVEVVVFGDVTYGACCIDDFTANSMKCDFIIHYAHSCLVPVNQMLNGIKVLYVFVDIKFDLWHFIETVALNFDPHKNNFALASTIQFVTSIHSAAKELREKHNFKVYIPQSKPLSPGEVLGCTASKLPQEINTILFVADGRFHLEAILIANPNVEAYKYNPYNKEITKESYDFEKMTCDREKAIETSTQVCQNEGIFGLILGTLGRQGNPKILQNLIAKLAKSTKCNFINLLLPEIKPETLNLFTEIDGWVQIACPRLSIDWGNNFTSKPLLTPYEFSSAIKSFHSNEKICQSDNYPMDFYASNSHGDWTPNHKCSSICNCEQEKSCEKNCN